MGGCRDSFSDLNKRIKESRNKLLDRKTVVRNNEMGGIFEFD